MFADFIGKTMEAYVDDMQVKEPQSYKPYLELECNFSNLAEVTNEIELAKMCIWCGFRKVKLHDRPTKYRGKPTRHEASQQT